MSDTLAEKLARVSAQGDYIVKTLEQRRENEGELFQRTDKLDKRLVAVETIHQRCPYSRVGNGNGTEARALRKMLMKSLGIIAALIGLFVLLAELGAKLIEHGPKVLTK